jgi:hypothetical protein
MSNKKEYAPTVKLYAGKKSGTYGASINDRVLETLMDLTNRIEKGGRIGIRPVSDAYKAKCDGDAPEFEFTVYTAKEVESFKEWAKNNRSDDSAQQEDSI